MSMYTLSRKAEQDLKEIYFYGYHEYGEQQADHYVHQLEKAFTLLAENPLICRERNEFTPTVRMHAIMKHLIIYIYQKDNILIVRLLHERMDVKSHLHSL